MNRLIRSTGDRVGRAIRTAGCGYIKMITKHDPNNVGYYVW